MRRAAGAGDDRDDAALGGADSICEHFVGHAMGRNDAHLARNSELDERIARRRIVSQSDRLPMMMPTIGASLRLRHREALRAAARLVIPARAEPRAGRARRNGKWRDFWLGINYWPRRSAMYAWQRFDLGEIREDMARTAELGFDVVRFFLMWEAFAARARRSRTHGVPTIRSR